MEFHIECPRSYELTRTNLDWFLLSDVSVDVSSSDIYEKNEGKRETNLR
jgi:hypothetical protein